MKESELLENVSKLERTSKVLEIKIKVWKDENEKLDLIRRNKEVKAEIEKLKRNLATINETKETESQETKRSKIPEKVEEAESHEEQKNTGNVKISEAIKDNEEETRNSEGEEDDPYKQLSELELLKKLSQLEKDADVLENKIEVEHEEMGKTDLVKQKDEIKGEIEKLKKNLESINNKRYGEEAKYAIIRQLKENILEINDSGNGKIENKKFQKKFDDLFFFLAKKVSGVSVPDFPSFKIDGHNSIDAKKLSEFLIQEVQTVTNITAPTYTNLRAYLVGLKDRIIERFINKKTNIQNPPTMSN